MNICVARVTFNRLLLTGVKQVVENKQFIELTALKSSDAFDRKLINIKRCSTVGAK